MFFESAFEGKNQWWRYLVMFLVAFLVANVIGSIPLIIAIAVKTAQDPSILEAKPENLADFSVYGIDPNVSLVYLVLPFLVGLLAFILLIKPLNGRSFTSVVNGTRAIRWGRIVFSFLVWTLLFAVYLLVTLRLDPGNYRLNNTSSSLIILALIAILLVPFQTTFEEVLFRGYLMQGLGVAFRSKWWPLIITSVLFGLMHAINPEVKEFGFFVMMPQYIGFGLLFGLLTVFDDGIELAMGAHAANNVFLSIFLTQESSTLQTDAMYEQQVVYPWTDFISLALIGVVFIFIMKFVYKWKGNIFSLKSKV
ncbi:MAG: type II CAAX endopeptidase family protein [Marinilabiliaceae bacterium]|jgi:membrane protease YdiL (CAAX protease family)|nr:type II CAAX endopeptidase family protein [Marinilabiliaceae bacterium]